MGSQPYRRTLLYALAITALGFASCAEKELTVAQGLQISLVYTLELDDGTVVKSNVNGEPEVFTVGSGKLVRGLERELEGMKIGEEKHVTILPEDGYGPVIPEAILEVPKSRIPKDALTVGAMMEAPGPTGQIVRARVTEVKEETAVVDMNHPLAGKTLHYTVKVQDIRTPAE